MLFLPSPTEGDVGADSASEAVGTSGDSEVSFSGVDFTSTSSG